MKISAFTVVVVAVAATAVFSPAGRVAAQDPGSASELSIDENLVKKGKTLWTQRACSGCHSIGKGKLAGPDLAHLTDRRSVDWVKKWLGNTTSMLESDETAKALLAEYNNTKMPDFKMKEEDAMAVLHYIAKESQKVKKK